MNITWMLFPDDLKTKPNQNHSQNAEEPSLENKVENNF